MEKHLSLSMDKWMKKMSYVYIIYAAAAKSLQSCPTLCDPTDDSPWRSCPWDSPGKNTGVGCHFLLQCMKVKSESEVAQSCLTLSDPMDCSPPGSSAHGIFQARLLEWVASAFSCILYIDVIHNLYIVRSCILYLLYNCYTCYIIYMCVYIIHMYIYIST